MPERWPVDERATLVVAYFCAFWGHPYIGGDPYPGTTALPPATCLCGARRAR